MDTLSLPDFGDLLDNADQAFSLSQKVTTALQRFRDRRKKQLPGRDDQALSDTLELASALQARVFEVQAEAMRWLRGWRGSRSLPQSYSQDAK